MYGNATCAPQRANAVLDAQGKPFGALRQSGQQFFGLLKARLRLIVAMALTFAGFMMPQLITHASTAITIDTDILFGSVNDWISTFLPIFAIGLGIAIAIAIISIVGDSILQGLRKGLH